MTEPAPLITTADAPAPPGGGAEWFQGSGGAKLRAAYFAPKGKARGSVVLSAGRTEPLDKYFEVIGELLDRGFVVLTHDWRGQGLSHRDLPDRLKGHADGFKPYLGDYHALLATFEPRLPKPWIALGHSMGGCLTLLALAHGEADRFVGAVLSAPMLLIKSPLGIPVTRFLTGLFGKGDSAKGYVLGNRGKPFDSTFENNRLTHDRARFMRYRGQIDACRDLAIGGPTWGWLAFALEAADYIADRDNLKGVTIPVTICSAGGDRIVENAAQRLAAKNLPNATFVDVGGAHHEVLMETDDKRAQFWTAFDALADRATPKAKPAAAPKPTVSKAKPAAKPKAAKPKPVKSPPA